MSKENPIVLNTRELSCIKTKKNGVPVFNYTFSFSSNKELNGNEMFMAFEFGKELFQEKRFIVKIEEEKEA